MTEAAPMLFNISPNEMTWGDEGRFGANGISELSLAYAPSVEVAARVMSDSPIVSVTSNASPNIVQNANHASIQVPVAAAQGVAKEISASRPF